MDQYAARVFGPLQSEAARLFKFVQPHIARVHELLERWQDTLRPIAKTGVVCAGYAAAAAIAVACRLLLIYVTRQPDCGAYAFGQTLLCLALFQALAVPPTGVGLFFLRPYPAFWRMLSAIALAVACVGLVLCADTAVNIFMPAHRQSMIEGIAGIGVFAAPFFALAFGTAGLFAPSRDFRISFFAAAVIECVGFAAWIIACLCKNF